MAGRPTTREAPPFGRKLAVLRNERGWSQKRFAEVLGISRAMVEYYERRAKNPSTDFVKHVAEVLDVAAADLIDDDLLQVSAPRRRRSGPKSALETRFEQLRKLPKKEQEVVIHMLDGLLAQRTHS